MNTPLKFAIAVLLSASTLTGFCQKAHFRGQTIDDKVGIGYGIALADVNGDKKPDIILVDKAEVSWYENPSWEKHVIAEKLTPIDHVCIAAQDIDGDGKAEIAIGAGWNPGDTVGSGAVFYLIPPADRRQKWTPVELPHEPTVHRMWWVKNGDKYNLVVLPLHGRGNKNGAGDPVRMLEYIMPSDPHQTWTTKQVNIDLHMSHNFDPIHWTPSSSQEMLVCGKEGVFRLGQNNGEWKVRDQITGAENAGFPGAGEVRLGNLKQGHFIATVEPMHGTNFVVYTAPAKEGLWKRHLIDDSINDGHALACGDLLHTGQDQIVAGWRGKNAAGKAGIKIYSATDSKGENWKGEAIDDGGMACEDLRLADLDGDGWLDVVASGRATKNLRVYWNEGGKK